MRIRGIYSTEAVDRDNEVILSKNIKLPEEGELPIDLNFDRHRRVGTANKFWIDDEKRAWFEGEIENEGVVAKYLGRDGVPIWAALAGNIVRSKEVQLAGAAAVRITAVKLWEIGLTHTPSNTSYPPIEIVKE